jgi:hypothetical protein
VTKSSGLRRTRSWGVVWHAVGILVLAVSTPMAAQLAGKGQATASVKLVEDPGLRWVPGREPSATRDYVRSLTFVKDSFVYNVNCHGGRIAKIAIWPEVRSHLLDPEHVQKRGRIVARIKNLGPAPCRDFRLAKGEEAYWWMGPDLGDPFMTEFWHVNPNGTARRLAGGSTRFNKDARYDRPSAYIGPPTNRHPVGKEMELKLFGHTSTWIACLGGCCESISIDAFTLIN